MAKRKFPMYYRKKVFEENDDYDASDDEEPVAGPRDEKRFRRVSDVIDSFGDREYNLPEGFTTPRRPSKMKIDLVSPDQGYSATPDSVNVFLPDWMNKTPDRLDADPNIFPTIDDDSPSIPTGFVASMPVDEDADCYNMTHRKRGKCVVFNHEKFDMGFEYRKGSDNDAKRIEQTFRNLGFDVEILLDWEFDEIKVKIKELSEDNHEDADCICIFVLTHGISNNMICAKNVAYMADAIWKPFTADNCKTLAGKPKLFFFQACRGNKLDDGITLQRNYTARTQTDSSGASYKVPTHADFLLAHSTVDGFYSWRNPTSGTWFVQCLCDVIDEHADRTDLLKMMTIAARRIATKRESYDDIDQLKCDKKQVPSITSMLIRELYFTPKRQRSFP